MSESERKSLSDDKDERRALLEKELRELSLDSATLFELINKPFHPSPEQDIGRDHPFQDVQPDLTIEFDPLSETEFSKIVRLKLDLEQLLENFLPEYYFGRLLGQPKDTNRQVLLLEAIQQVGQAYIHLWYSIRISVYRAFFESFYSPVRKSLGQSEKEFRDEIERITRQKLTPGPKSASKQGLKQQVRAVHDELVNELKPAFQSGSRFAIDEACRNAVRKRKGDLGLRALGVEKLAEKMAGCQKADTAALAFVAKKFDKTRRTIRRYLK